MARRNFAEILKSAKIDLLQEYNRLFRLFYLTKDNYGIALVDECKKHFLDMPFRGTCLSLADFNESNGFYFKSNDAEFNTDYLIIFCEYTYNLISWLSDYATHPFKAFYMEQMMMVLDLIDHEFVYNNDAKVHILVPKNQEALAVAEFVDEEISYSVLEYNHHSFEGNLSKKKATLKLMADDIEPQRKILNGINKTLADNLFQMLQKFVRHNNDDNPYIQGLSEEELENCYDDIYQMWLLAKLEIDNLERKKRVEETLRRINA